MDYKLLGKNIRKYRKQKGLGQEELAEMEAEVKEESSVEVEVIGKGKDEEETEENE